VVIVFHHPFGPGHAPLGVYVQDGGKLTSNDVLCDSGDSSEAR